MQTRFFHVPALVERFQRAVLEHEHDVVLAQLVRTSEWVPENCPVPVILDMVDLFSYSYSRAPGFASIPWRMVMAVEQPRLKQYERECVHRFQSILLASAAECEYLRQATWGKNITHVMNGVECPEILTQQLPLPDRSPRILFFGKLDYPPNADAAIHFAQDLFPGILHNVPNARFVIAGWEPPRAIHRLAHDHKNIEILPDLDDLRPEIMRASVTVVPMRSGGGLQNKILESLACGTPVVTYPHSADAFGANPPEGLLVATGREAFVGNVLDVLTSPSLRTELATAARTSIARDFTWENTLEPLDLILKSFTKP